MEELRYPDKTPQRLDRFILQQMPWLTQGQLHKYLRENKIKLNGKKVPLNTTLTDGDVVRIYLPPAARQLARTPQLAVIFEDDNLLAVNKPAGMATLDEANPDAPGTLLALVRGYLAERSPGVQSTLCHRLDTGTSGVVLVAKTAPFAQVVLDLMRKGAMKKRYVAVTFGHPVPPEGTLGGFLHKDAARGVVRITPHRGKDGKPVETRYHTRATSGRLALLHIELITGRTHQIRAHMASIGTPLLGDSKYGNLAANRELRCRYQCLCASEIVFPQEMPAPYEWYARLEVNSLVPWFYQQVLEGELK